MTLRILAHHEEGLSNPYLNAEAANRAWLIPALRRRGLDVDDVPQPGKTYDLIHAHADDAPLVAPTLKTTYGLSGTSSPAVAVAARLIPAGGLRASVIYPPIDCPEPPFVHEPGDALVMHFDGRDEFALASAIAVATRAERPLTIVMDSSTAVAESCNAALQAGLESGWLDVERYEAAEFPLAIASAAAVLSFSRNSFDMAALTAMAVGTPVIALQETPAAEVHIHGETGFVAANAEEAARYVDRLDLLNSNSARTRARIAFSPDTAARAYADLYGVVVSGRLPVFQHPEMPADVSGERYDSIENASVAAY